tara:strand:- start:1030 stop:3036 length:2007 start_codon:yes stop_codon:yes gene_type:complete
MAAKRKYNKKSEYWNKFDRKESIEQTLAFNPLLQNSTYSPSIEGEAYFNSTAKASSYARSGSSTGTRSRTNRIHKVPQRDKFTNIRDGLLPFDYAVNGINVRDTIELCQKAYANVAIFRNAIDIMAEFSNSEIFLDGGSKKSRDFINAWFRKIKLWKLTDQYFREYYRSGNIFFYKIDGKFNTEDFIKMTKTYGSVSVNKIPIRYILLNPFDVVARRTTGFETTGVYAKVLSEYEIERLKNPKNDYDREVYEGLPKNMKDNFKMNGYQPDGAKIELEPESLRYSFYKKQDYEPFAVPFGYSVLQDINMKLEFKKIDQAIVRTIENVILLITMGNEPSKGGINHNNLSAMQELFRNESVGRVLVSDYTTNAEFVIPDMNKILGYEKYRIVNEDIKEGLQNIIVGSEKYSNTAVKAEIFLERLKESRQSFLNDFLQPEIKQVCKNMGFKNYPTARFKEVDTKDSTQTQRVATRLMELGLITPEQGMDVINKGVFPESEEINKSQDKFIEQRKKGHYNPIVGGVPMVEPEENDTESKKQETQKVPGLPGRPVGTKDIPQEVSRANVSTENIIEVIKASENFELFCKKAARAHFKIKKLNKDQNKMIEDLCKKVIIAKDITDWETTAGQCIKNNKNILKLDLSEEVAKTASDHSLTDYTAAIIYHSKEFSNR